MRILVLMLLMIQLVAAQSGMAAKIDSLLAKNLFGEIVKLVERSDPAELESESRFYYSLALAQTGEHERSLAAFQQLKSTLADTAALYRSCLFYIGILERDHFNLGTAVSCFSELIAADSLEYAFYPEIIQCYFRMEDYASAKPYQDFLYRAYREKRLPPDMAYLYVYDTFVLDTLFVRCSEAYPALGSPETEGSFSKTFAYVVNQEGQLLYVLETVKIHQREENPQKYLLNKRFYDAQWKLRYSESFWQYTFSDPIDYAQLRAAIVAVIQTNPEPAVQSVFK